MPKPNEITVMRAKLVNNFNAYMEESKNHMEESRKKLRLTNEVMADITMLEQVIAGKYSDLDGVVEYINNETTH